MCVCVSVGECLWPCHMEWPPSCPKKPSRLIQVPTVFHLRIKPAVFFLLVLLFSSATTPVSSVFKLVFFILNCIVVVSKHGA